jgi:DsbC/DsbD-like thiol-disulfide interchange protein
VAASFTACAADQGSGSEKKVIAQAGPQLGAAAAPAAAPASDKDSIVQPTLLADTTAVKPGTTFTLGILYKLQPEWHIYYKNPGESGFATTVQWNLPEGASVGETMYPAPLTFESPGPVMCYGYEGEAMLLAEVNLGKAPADGKVTITAKTRWLMCSDRCIPNSKELTLTLPVGEPEPANADVFSKYKKLVPKKVGALPENAKITATPSGSSMTYELTITPPAGKQIAAGDEAGHGAHMPFFYPTPAKGYVLQAPKVTGKATQAGSIKVYDGPVTITWKSDPEVNAAEPLKRLDGTLVYQTVTNGKLDDPVLVEVGQKL